MLRPGDYYRGRTILLTGTTGLVGRVVLETLLRQFPDVRRIHALIRPRRDDAGHIVPAVDTLARDVLGSSAFDSLRREHGDGFTAFVGERVVAVAGDIGQPALGMAAEDRARLAAEVDLIINCAALAVFDAPLDEALTGNALAPGHVLEFAELCAEPPFVAHVSTCYVNNLAGPVFETPPIPGADDPTDPAGRFDVDAEIKALQTKVERLASASAAGNDPAAVRKRLVEAGLEHARARGWNDTYTFTKALGEQRFTRRRGNIPGLILRPSIIESAVAHPAPGWIDGFRMVDPLIVGFARGQIFEFPGHPDTVLDVIPVDRVVNALLMAIPWCHQDGGPEVFQVASGMDNPLRLAVLRDALKAYYERRPLRRAAQGSGGRVLPDLTFPETAPFLHRLRWRYLQPLDWLGRLHAPLRSTTWGRHRHASLAGRHARLQRLHDMAAIYGPYAQSRVRYMACNTRALEQQMSAAERSAFPCGAGDFDWQHYLQGIHLPGIERYLLRMRRPPEERSGEAAGHPAQQDGDAGSTATDVRGNDRWLKAQRLLAATRPGPEQDAREWLRPARAFGLQRSSVGLLRGICRLYLDLRAEGHEHLPQRGPFIVVANHCSHVDTAVLLAALGHHAERVHPTAAADYWFRSRMLGWALHATLAAIPFDRKAPGVPRALSLPAEVLRNGHSLIFYPEGTRSNDGELRRFKSTVGLLALAAAAPVVPAHVEGTLGVLPRGRTLPRPNRVSVRFGPPIPPDAYLRRLQTENVTAVARDIASDSQVGVAALAAMRAAGSASSSSAASDVRRAK